MTTVEVSADEVPGANQQVTTVLTVTFLAYLGQFTLSPVIAPLSRELHLGEWQVGLMISTAAVMVVLTSQLWGRRSQSWGRRPVLLSALAAAALATGAFAALSVLGMQAVLGGTALVVLLVLTRGVLYGGAIGAVAPTAQAFIANVTRTEHERVRGMAAVGAVQGVAMIAGSAFGGLLAGWSMTAALVAVPLAMVAALVLVLARLRPESSTTLIPDPPKVSPLDSRVWPFLAAAVGMMASLGFIQVLTGFLIQDRLQLSPGRAALLAGAGLLCAGLGMVAAQVVLVPRLRRGPVALLRLGAATALVGFIVLVPAATLPTLLVSMVLIGVGLGIGMPGYTAGPSLTLSDSEQGGLAGLLGAANALTFVVTPTLSTVLYATEPVLPVVVSAVLMALVLLFVLLHPRMRALHTSSRDA